MFATTFLGHQGWVFQSERACLLADPLLEEEFGQAHALERRVYPPRVFKMEAFPKVDGVILTHEHDDHFDIPSLARLDRRIPIYLSVRSSSAARQILSIMGFQVRPLVPGTAFACGDLEVLPQCGDHVNTNSGDEWDALPFSVRHAGGAGNFFTTVDCTLTSDHIARARAFTPRPGIIGWANNAQDWSHMIDLSLEQTQGTEQCVLGVRQGLSGLTSMWGVPAALVICAGGFSFYGARKWFNKRVFSVDADRAVKMLSGLHPDQIFLAGRPGHTLYMQDNTVKRVEKQTPFLATASPKTWPVREKGVVTEFPDYVPATGRQELTSAELEQLRQRMNEFAASLVGGNLFKNLFSLLDTEAADRRCTFAFVARQGEKLPPLVFMYNSSTCSFEETPTANPRQSFVAGMECWAADLLAVLSGELGDIALLFGRASLWNHLPQRLNFDMFGELQRISCALRRPTEYLRIYERILRTCGEVPPTILART